MASFLQSHFEQVVGFLPLAVLVLDVGFKAMLGNRDLHSFGGDLSLCGFVVYLGAVLHVLDFAPETLKGTAMITATRIGLRKREDTNRTRSGATR